MLNTIPESHVNENQTICQDEHHFSHAKQAMKPSISQYRLLTVHAFFLQTEIIRYHGYPAEEYTVQTEDGYLLYIQRIPAGRMEDSCDIHGCPPKEVVFLQHGLLCASSNWITNLPNESFAFLLADAGFDVWMGNVRGNTYGLRHIKYKTNSNKFWDFRYLMLFWFLL